MTKPKEALDLDAILVELGQFGRYQIITYCYITLPILFSAIYNAQFIFAAAEVNYRCQVPNCEESPPQMEAGPWGAWALPEGGGQCQRQRPLGSACSPENFDPNDTITCNSWVYENNDSIVTEFDLACQEWKRTMVGTVHSIGLFAALPLTAYISDNFGRRTAFIVTAVMPAIIGLIRSFSNSYIMYLVFEFIEPTLGSGVYSSGFILALEMVGLNRRVLGGNLISCTFAMGQVCLALVAWAVPHWRTMTRLIYAPSFVFVFYYFFIEESVRWLLSRGKKAEAARIIFKAAEINKKKLSPNTIKQLSMDSQTADGKDTHGEALSNSTSEAKEPSLLMSLLRSKILMGRLCICSFWWITVTFVYYGLSINSVSLAGNKYLNFILTSLVEVPGYCISIITLDRFGRKSSIMTAYFLCGFSLLVQPFVPSTMHWLKAVLMMAGKLCISMAFSSIYVYTSELFPTTARHRLLGVCSMFGRVGNIVAPQTPLLMKYMKSLPYLLFGAMAFTSGLLMLLTPETLNIKLPDTVHQAENMVAAPHTRKNPPAFIVY